MQSSNSVFVLQPSQSNRDDDDDIRHGVSMSAIAKCGVILELVPSAPSMVDFLKHLLPIYTGHEDIPSLGPSALISKDALLEDAPCSSGEFDNAWSDLCAFELDGHARLPTASALVNIWTSIISNALVRDVGLADGFPIDALSGVVEEDGHPNSLFQAVILRLSSNPRDLMGGCE